jgi:hypothetical protein
MKLESRVKKLEAAPPTLAPNDEPITLSEAMALDCDELRRRIKVELKRPRAPMSAAEHRAHDLEAKRLSALPLDELERLYANATGEKRE